LNPAIPASIDALIRRSLAIDPQRRFQDADEMGSELERAMRLMADQPLDPYLAGATIVTATEDDTTEPGDAAGIGSLPPVDDDDRTMLVFDDDDRTLLAPPPPPPPPPAAPTAATPAPRRPAAGGTPSRPSRAAKAAPTVVQPRKKRGGLFVWTLVTLTLLVAGMWLFNEMTKPGTGPSLADQLQ